MDNRDDRHSATENAIPDSTRSESIYLHLVKSLFVMVINMFFFLSWAWITSRFLRSLHAFCHSLSVVRRSKKVTRLMAIFFGNKQSFELFFLYHSLIEMPICNMYMKPVESQDAEICYIHGARHILKSKWHSKTSRIKNVSSPLSHKWRYIVFKTWIHSTKI